MASPDGRDGSLTIHSDASLYTGSFAAGQRQTLGLARGRHAWVQVTRGALLVQGRTLAAGDGAALSDEAQLALEGSDAGEVLVFDLG